MSVLEVGGGIAEVIATSGDSKLGGDDFDQVSLIRFARPCAPVIIFAAYHVIILVYALDPIVYIIATVL